MLSLPKLIGHRGVKDLAPENTLVSIKKAYELGLKWVEVDVKISQDNIPILLHDNTLDRTTNGSGIPINLSYSKLKKLDAGKFFYNTSTDINIPTLDSAVLLCRKKNIGLNIELKPNNGFEKKNILAIANLFQNYNFNIPHYFSSFDFMSIIELKKLLPKSPYGILIDKFDKKMNLEKLFFFCKKNKIKYCGFNKNILNQELVSKIKNNNLIITAFSNKNFNLKEAETLWNLGVNSLFIDDPTIF